MKLVILLLAALVAAPPLLAQPSAQDLDKQVETMELIRDQGSIWFGWLIEQIGVEWPDKDPGPLPEKPGAQSDGKGGTSYDLRGVGRPITHEEFLELLSPYYEQEGTDPGEISTHDAWGHALEFRFRWNVLKSQVMSIRSPGRDGVFSEPVFTLGPYPTGQVDDDIVWADGFFLRYPGGGLERMQSRR